MTEETKGRKITFHCPDDVADRLDRMAELGDIPRSRLVLNLVEMMLGFLETTEKVGILQMTLLLKDAGNKLKDVAKDWRERKSLKGLVK